MTLRIFNSLTRRLEPFVPIVPGRVGMYVCGMTIYDLCHIGHARFLIAFDLVYRWLLASSFDVTYVRNITDIDDKIIRRSVERGIPMRALTDEMTAAMHADLAALGLLPPTLEPRATDHVPQMLDMIAALERNGLAYQAAGGDVNFAVRKFADYGRLSGKSIDELRSGERVAVDDGKDDPLDFVLWKATKPGEPEEARWSSPYGSGRPGWHIECSAMACTLLGTHFDIHGGGIDLQFPHHENEIAQSVGAHGGRFVDVWMHNGHLNVDGQKMSKSLGNFITIRDVLADHDGETLRYAVLRNHYRSPYNYTAASLADARNALRRLYTALDGTPPGEAAATIDWSAPAAALFRSAMDDDLNTPAAVAVLFDLAGEVNRLKSPETARLLRSLGGTLGVLQQAPRTYLQGGASDGDAAVERLIADRAAAKLARDFARADAIRRELEAGGVSLQDSAAGTTWSRA